MRFHPKRFATWLAFLYIIISVFLMLTSDNQQTVPTVTNFIYDKQGSSGNAKMREGTIGPAYEGIMNYRNISKLKKTEMSKSKNDTSKEHKIQDLFPFGDEVHDRVLEQMKLKLPVTKNKTILVFSGHKTSGNVQFINDQCPMMNCYITNNRNTIATADAILFKSIPRGLDGSYTNPNQVRIVYLLESPHHSSAFTGIGTYVNWTATYRRDSVINTPYERFTPYPGSVIPEKASRNYATNKTKLVAWFVSNCNAPNGRLKYAKELQKYISVDIYGGCGPLKCSQWTSSKQCFNYLDKDYKFYLAFENSNCKDYITEKFFVNGLQ